MITATTLLIIVWHFSGNAYDKRLLFCDLCEVHFEYWNQLRLHMKSNAHHHELMDWLRSRADAHSLTNINWSRLYNWFFIELSEWLWSFPFSNTRLCLVIVFHCFVTCYFSYCQSVDEFKFIPIELYHLQMINLVCFVYFRP